MTTEPINLLEHWLERQLDPVGFHWLRERLARRAAGQASAELYKTLGLIPRRLGKEGLALSEQDLEAAALARVGWDPRGWTVDQAARILVLVRLAAAETADFPRLFVELCRSAEVGEAIAFYRGLPLYPQRERLEQQAAEGLRTHMRAVFEAISHRSPYPRECFSDGRWNQMVLKALFIGSALDPIQGLDERANPELAAILADYAHERWAAGRPVPPELWRCIGPFATGKLIDDLKKVAASGDLRERQAAALALSMNSAPEPRRLLAGMPDLAEAVRAGQITWDRIAHPA